MEAESPTPKKRVYKRKAAVVSDEILDIVEDLEGETTPKPKRVYKRKSTAKSSVSAQPTTISVQHNTHTDSLRPAMPVAKTASDDPFAILDKDLEFKDFFEKYEQKNIHTTPKSPTITVPKKVVQPEESRRNAVKESYDDLEDGAKIKRVGGKFWKWLSGIILLVGMGYAGYVYAYPRWFKVDYLRDLGKVAVLPTNETPVAYLVTKEAELLKDPLFAGVQVGDRVFLYEKNKKMYIYRETMNKVVTIATIDTASTTEATPAPAVAEQSATTTATNTNVLSTTTKATTTPTASTTKKTTATTTKK